MSCWLLDAGPAMNCQAASVQSLRSASYETKLKWSLECVLVGGLTGSCAFEGRLRHLRDRL